MSYHRLWLLVLFIKFFLISIIPFANDEAYYWVWGQHLQLSYYDHPPLVGWLFSLGSIGFENSTLSKWPLVVLGHLSFFLWNELLKNKLNLTQQKELLILFCLLPLSGIGSLVATPDVPLLFSWTLCLYLIYKLHHNYTHSHFFLLGLALGFCFLAKYHAVLFIPPALFVLWKARPNLWLFLQGFLLTLVGCLLVSSPVLIWNFHNEWISFKFQLGHGLSSAKWNPLWPVLYVLSQFLLIFPTLLFSSWRSRTQQFFDFHIMPFLIFPLLFFFCTSFFARVEPNWTSMSLPIATALGYLGFENFKSKLWKNFTYCFLAFINLVLIAELFWQIIPYPLKTNELYRYKALSHQSSEFSPLFARTYQMASQLTVLTGRPISKLRGFNRVDFFDFQKESTPHVSPYYVAVESNEELPSIYKTIGHQIVERINIDREYDIIKVVFE